MMHADDRSLRAHRDHATGHRPLPALGAWVFVPADAPHAVFDTWHADELLSPASGEPTRAEWVVRRSRRGAPGVDVLVRGVVLHGTAVPLVLAGWHRAVRT